MKRWDFVLLLTAWLVAVLFIASGQFADPDLWGRLSVAALFFQNGHFPYHDVFSFTAPHALWIDHEWLTGMVFYPLLTKLGEPAFLLFKYLLLLACFGLIFRLHRRTYQVSPLYAFYGLLALAPVYAIGWYATLRSQVFSFLFFVLFISLLEAIWHRRVSPKALWGLLAVGVIWGNLHGGFIVGVLLIVGYGLAAALAERSLKAAFPYWLTAGGIFGLLALLNPYGPAYLRFLLHAWTLDRSHISEWNDIDLHSMQFLNAQLLMAGVLFLLLWRWRAVLRAADSQAARRNLIAPTLTLLWVIAMTKSGIRFQSFLALATVAYLPLLCPSQWPQAVSVFFQKQALAFTRTLPLLLLITTLGGLTYLQATTDLLHIRLEDELARGSVNTRYPLGALNYLESSPYHGNLMVRFGLGEFVYWRLYPRYRVSMDGRYEEVYSQQQFLQNQRFYDRLLNALHPAQAMEDADRLQVDFVLTETEIPHTAVFNHDPHWTLLYGDDYYWLFGRKTALQQFPPYHPRRAFVTAQWLTIRDMVTPANLARFRAMPPSH